jgi:hypothetical protein
MKPVTTYLVVNALASLISFGGRSGIYQGEMQLSTLSEPLEASCHHAYLMTNMCHEARREAEGVT